MGKQALERYASGRQRVKTLDRAYVNCAGRLIKAGEKKNLERVELGGRTGTKSSGTGLAVGGPKELESCCALSGV